MGKKKHKKNKKSEIDLMTWLVGAITDLTIGLILVIISKLLE